MRPGSGDAHHLGHSDGRRGNGDLATRDHKREAAKQAHQVVARVLLLIAIVLVVFVKMLPRVVDYDAVRAALSSLTTTQLVVLVVATSIAYVANAAPSRILIPALSWPRAVGVDLAARAVVSTIPGPTDVATRFVLYRQWAIPADTATAGIVFAAFFEQLSALVLPVIATVGVVVTGHVTRPAVIWLSLISVIVLVLGFGLLMGLVRWDSLTSQFGDWLQRVATRLWRLFRRTPPSGIAQGVMDIRERSEGHTLSPWHRRVRGRGRGEARMVRCARGLALVGRHYAGRPATVGRPGGHGGRRACVADPDHSGRRRRGRGRSHRLPLGGRRRGV